MAMHLDFNAPTPRLCTYYYGKNSKETEALNVHVMH